MDGWLDALKQFGPWVVAVAFFVWRDSKRELRLGKRLDHITDEHNRVTEVVIKNNTEALKTIEKELRRWADIQWMHGLEQRHNKKERGE